MIVSRPMKNSISILLLLLMNRKYYNTLSLALISAPSSKRRVAIGI
jgi:hypothetical protein